MADQKQISIVRESYGRCSQRKTFFQDFYDIFMDSSPAIKPYFTKTDMTKQRQLLRQGISFMILYADQNAAGRLSVEHIGELHDIEHVNVKPELYTYWTGSLLKCIEKHDKFFNKDIQSAWDAVLALGINHFTSVFQGKNKPE